MGAHHSVAQKSVEWKLRHARSKPPNDQTLRQLDRVFAENPDNVHDGIWNVVRKPGVEPRRRGRDSKKRYDQARESVRLALQASHGHLVGSSDAKNGTGNTDVAGQDPENPLVAIVADAHNLRQRVRAIGSGHSFSDITYSTNAVLVDMTLLKRVAMMDNGEEGIVGFTKPSNPTQPLSSNCKKRRQQPHNVSTSTDLLINIDVEPPDDEPPIVNRSRKLARVQAGITIRELNDELDNRGLALVNMGAFDGQTLAGVMSTGTHGSGIAFGPLASFVRAIVLVSENATVYQIEPASANVGKGPLSNPASFPHTVDGLPIELKQDDDWFRTALVAMGCDDVRRQLLPELWAPIAPAVAGADHFELVLNPYTRWSHNSCVRVERNHVTHNTKPSGARKDWLSTLLEQFGIHSIPHMIGVLNRFPTITPIAVNRAISLLVESGPYTDKSFRVLNLGPANSIKGMAMELHCDASQCVPIIDELLDVFNDEAENHEYYMAGPLGIRFTAASDAFLAPEAGRITCAIELDMLVGVETGVKLAQAIKDKMCTDRYDSPRIHWGLDLDFVTEDDIRSWYPDFESWHAVYRQLNSTGMFNNKFTRRMGISVPT
ncbi:oxidoreductase [Ophiostoma piceae UAMH 11346]|uniref:D-arabinono-1,4-lactone oxidase n=1 Tax=Ophiostoma piceae (strain UAMH 11346) TaxID=1262450 RepID=S3D7J1_OPHP1|nr:oxidoreductase [Ophiostoma piceae UAMH 11346]